MVTKTTSSRILSFVSTRLQSSGLRRCKALDCRKNLHNLLKAIELHRPSAMHSLHTIVGSSAWQRVDY